MIPLKNSRFNIGLQWFGGTSPPVFSGSNIDNATRNLGNAEDAPVTGWDKADPFIVAIAFEAMNKATDTITYQLEWRNKTDAGSFALLLNTGVINWTGDTNLVNQSPLTSGEAICTGTGAFVDGYEKEGSNNQIITLAKNTWTELQWAIDSSGAIDGKEYEFRLWDSSNSVVVGTSLATITIAAGAIIHQLAGSTDSISLLSGAINVLRLIIGSTDSVSLLTGTLGVLQLLSGTIDSISLLSGSIDVVVKYQLAGSTDSVSILGSNIDVIRSLISTTDSISLLSGTINRVVDISGFIESISLLSSNIDLIKDIKGSIDSITLLSGDLSVTGGGVIVSLQGTIDSVSLLSGLFNINIPINGTTDSVSLLSGNIDLIKDIKGSIDSISLFSGVIDLTKDFKGSIDSISLLSGSLTILGGGVRVPIEGLINSVTLLSGNIDLIKDIKGSIDSISLFSGNLIIIDTPPVNLQGPIIGLFGGPVVSWR